MDHTIAIGDDLIIWWPNGAGYDLYRVAYSLTGTKFIHMGIYEVQPDGAYLKKEDDQKT